MITVWHIRPLLFSSPTKYGSPSDMVPRLWATDVVQTLAVKSANLGAALTLAQTCRPYHDSRRFVLPFEPNTDLSDSSTLICPITATRLVKGKSKHGRAKMGWESRNPRLESRRTVCGESHLDLTRLGDPLTRKFPAIPRSAVENIPQLPVFPLQCPMPVPALGIADGMMSAVGQRGARHAISSSPSCLVSLSRICHRYTNDWFTARYLALVLNLQILDRGAKRPYSITCFATPPPLRRGETDHTR